MLEDLKIKVYEANIELPRRGLVIFTWGNVSAIDRETGYVVIKPSGVDYNTLKPEDMVVLDLDGNKIEGTLNPSSDTPTHLELYKKYKESRTPSYISSVLKDDITYKVLKYKNISTRCYIIKNTENENNINNKDLEMISLFN